MRSSCVTSHPIHALRNLHRSGHERAMRQNRHLADPLSPVLCAHRSTRIRLMRTHSRALATKSSATFASWLSTLGHRIAKNVPSCLASWPISAHLLRKRIQCRSWRSLFSFHLSRCFAIGHRTLRRSKVRRSCFSSVFAFQSLVFLE